MPAGRSTASSPAQRLATSKAEYTNTQQDLPVYGIYLAHLTRHEGYLALEVILLKCDYLLVLTFNILAQFIWLANTSQ